MRILNKIDFTPVLKLIFFFILILVLVLPSFFVLAQENMEELCQLEKIEEKEKILSKEDYRQLLEKCQKYFEEKSARIEEDINKTEKERKTLQNQIYILKKKIEKLSLQIYQSTLVIQDLGLQIKDTEGSIEKTSLKIEDSRNKLINILRTIYEEDQRSLVEILLSEPKLSAFFDNLMALEALNLKNQELLNYIKTLKSNLEEQKKYLDEEKTDLERVTKMQMLQKQENEKVKKDQEYFLKLTENQYQKYLKERETAQKRAAEIRARIFELIGVPKAPTFGEAYELAKEVERITGIRPAFLLAVLTQESNIGKNVGQCFLKNPSTGEGVVANTGEKIARVMKPTRDVQPFLAITKELGRDPYNTPVSCPMEFGFGGAMGPAQFIPSTWIRYQERVKEITGKTANPWSIKDAFLAAALYLKDYGASSQNPNDEWKAAMIYFSGTTNLKFRFYGDSVISIAKQYEQDIKAMAKFVLKFAFLESINN